MPDKRVVCYCDGACVNNGKENAIAGLAMWLKPEGYENTRELQVIKRIAKDRWIPTSQRAEVMCAITALQQFKRPAAIEVVSDSRYLVETMRGKMKKKSNVDLWEQLETEASKHKVSWTWRPRNSLPELAWCDRMATKSAREEIDDSALNLNM